MAWARGAACAGAGAFPRPRVTCSAMSWLATGERGGVLVEGGGVARRRQLTPLDARRRLTLTDSDIESTPEPPSGSSGSYSTLAPLHAAVQLPHELLAVRRHLRPRAPPLRQLAVHQMTQALAHRLALRPLLLPVRLPALPAARQALVQEVTKRLRSRNGQPKLHLKLSPSITAVSTFTISRPVITAVALSFWL